METGYLDRFINREIFLVAGPEDEESTEVFASEKWEGLLGHLSSKNPTIESGIRVFHGILTIAEFLPKSFKNKSAFVICMNPKKDREGFVIESESDDPESMAEQLELVISEGQPFVLEDPDIDDYFILYGYQLRTCMSVSQDEVDEEAIETCKEISSEVEHVGTLIRNS